MAQRMMAARTLATNVFRFAWYSGLNWRLAQVKEKSNSELPEFTPTRPMPRRSDLMAALRLLALEDAKRVRDGIIPAGKIAQGGDLSQYLTDVGAMLRDYPETLVRQSEKEIATAASFDRDEALPEYFRQDFHYQTGGYLTSDSARLYDVQVETLFYGTAGLMRRALLFPLMKVLRARDQRQLSLLDVACGTGRFLTEVREIGPGLTLTGLDLSEPYLNKAKKHARGLRAINWIAANAEEIPLANESQDIVAAVFLFHELPPSARRQVVKEISRVLKPGGVFLFLDSLQYGDRPEWDGMLEYFPARFHEPYFASYVEENLEKLFTDAGLASQQQENVFLSKMMVREKS